MKNLLVAATLEDQEPQSRDRQQQDGKLLVLEALAEAGALSERTKHLVIAMRLSADVLTVAMPRVHLLGKALNADAAIDRELLNNVATATQDLADVFCAGQVDQVLSEANQCDFWRSIANGKTDMFSFDDLREQCMPLHCALLVFCTLKKATLDANIEALLAQCGGEFCQPSVS